MKEISYLIAKVKYKLLNNNKEVVSDYFRRSGMKVGKRCNICCNIMTSEPYLVSLGNDVTISGNVTFVTHDNSIAKISPEYANIFGPIEIGNNCFLGQNSTILYGCTLADNIIVAAGSVVCSSFSESNIIIGGNPAKMIGNWEKFSEKGKDFSMKRTEAFDAFKEGKKGKGLRKRGI